MAATLFDINDAQLDLLDCVCSALTDQAVAHPGVPGCPCRRGLVPGEVAWDGCDSACASQADPPPADSAGGQLTVSLVRTYETTPQRFPSEVRPVRSLKACEPTVLAAEFDITLLRCLPIDDARDGCAAGMGHLETAASFLTYDMFAVRTALECCYAGTLVGSRNQRGRRFTVGPAVATGPQGGCVGFVQRVTVEMAEPLCCPTPAQPEALEGTTGGLS